jgi:phage terminase large subunit
MSKFVHTTAIKKIRRVSKRIKIIQGGSSSGKTYGILPILIDKATKTPNLAISVVAESLPHLRRGALRDFVNIMKMTGRFFRDHFNVTNSIYTFSNGSYIEFFSADNDSKLRGARRNILYINECNNITFDAYNQLAMRTDMDIYLDYNPTHQFWCDTEVEPLDDSEKIILTYKDNEALSQTVIHFLESKIPLAAKSNYWKNWVDVYVYGKTGRLEGVVFDNWSTIKEIPKEAKLLGYGMDFGFKNDPTALVAVYKWNGKIILKELIYETGLLNSDIHDKFTKLVDKNMLIWADSSEPKSIAELQRYGWAIYGATKGADSIIHGISLMQEYDLLITEDSQNLIKEFTIYSWLKDKATGKSTNKPEDKNNHGIDGVRYFFSKELRYSTEGNVPEVFTIGL